MNVINVKQGTPEWLESRKGQLTASLAPEMMGDGYHSRDKAIRKYIGIDTDDNGHMKTLFALAHEKEEAARPVAEKEYDTVFSPLVATRLVDGVLLYASYDGITFDNDLVWEHKYTGKSFDEQMQITKWQLEHQLLVADTTRAVLTITDRNSDDISHYEYTSCPKTRDALIEGWKQFIKDVAEYQRDDEQWLAVAKEYREIDMQIKGLSERRDAIGAVLREMAGTSTSCGGGVRVSVSQTWQEKQTPAAYIKEHKIELPVTRLAEPKTNYRITVEK